MKIRTIFELDEIKQLAEPTHRFVFRIFGIAVFKYNRCWHSAYNDEEDEDEEEDV